MSKTSGNGLPLFDARAPQAGAPVPAATSVPAPADKPAPAAPPGPPLRLVVNVDGGSRGNPGPAAAGVVVRADDGTVLLERGVFIGHATNNVAEYSGLLEGLRLAQTLRASEVEIVSDSELLVRQMNGQYRVKNAGLKPLYEKALDLARSFRRCSYRHVRREMNVLADRLANLAMDRKRNVESSE